MNSPADMRSFEAARRRQLIEATIDTVAEVGFRAASLSEIARRANVSQGLFAHYFGDKDGLLEATLRYMAARLPRVTAALMRAARTPLERVHAVSDAALADREFERRTSAVWLAFWGQIVHSEPNRRVQSIYQRRMRSNLRHGLRELVAAEKVEFCTTLIAAAIDGLWLQSHAGENRADKANHARTAVRELTAILIEANGPAPGRGAAPVLRTEAPPQDPLFAGLCEAQERWSAIDRAGRATLMRRFANALEGDRGAIALAQARETGLPVADTEAHDLASAVRAVECAADAARRPTRDSVSFGDGVLGFYGEPFRSPMLARFEAGVALVEILSLAARAFAEGRAVAICSPAGGARVLARFAKAAAKAGLPEGLLTLAQGADAERLLLSRPAGVVDAANRAPKSVALVAADADIRDAASKLVRGPRAWARARSFSETLIVVDERIRPTFVERLAAEVATLEIGDPTDRTVEIGPLASKAALERTLSLMNDARERGARIRMGGRAHESRAGGRAAFLKPTIVEGLHHQHALTKERLHAPVFLVTSFATEQEIVDRLAARRSGLSLVAFGRDFDAMLGVARAAGPDVCRIDCHLGAPAMSADDWLLEAMHSGGTRIAGRRPARGSTRA